MVTVGYEQQRGLRAKHQKADGFAANASKTISVAAEEVNGAWEDPARLAAWLPDAPLRIKRSTPGKSVRASWEGEPVSPVDVTLDAKGDAKCTVSVEHSKLPDAESAARFKAYWAAALVRLKPYLEAHA